MCLYQEDFHYKKTKYLVLAAVLKSVKSLIFQSKKKFKEKFDFKKSE